MLRRKARAMAVALAVGAALALAPTLSSQSTIAPASVSSTHTLRALRSFAEPGDYLLENDAVSAVVRRRDGALVDFFRKRLTIPTSDALGSTTDVDGVWDIVPVALLPSGVSVPATFATVAHDFGGVVTTGFISKGAYGISARIRYELAPDRPSLRIAVAFLSDQELPSDVELGLAVRWGNVAYFVEGNPNPLVAYAGMVHWAGRRGAGGDLLLRGHKPEKYQVRFQSRPGFQSALLALVERSPGPRRGVNAVYELSYEPLPLVPPPPQPVSNLEIHVQDELGRPLAAKATFQRKDDPKRAVFPPDGGLDGTERFAWTGNGTILSAPPPGPYTVLVTAGPEREVARREIVLAASETERFTAVLHRAVPTPGWVAADLHLHQAPSVDADISLEARLIAVAAEGVEFAVATDHYVVTDFYPVVRDLVSSGALARPLLTVAGIEVSTLWTRFGHFNVFPVPLDASIEYRDTTPSRLFAAARRESPEGVLQINHPRWEPSYGYFNYVELDPRTGRPRKAGFEPNFDTIEVYNGEDAGDLSKVEQVLHDFIHLLRSGRRYVATGGSDSHKLAFLDPGVPRTMIAHGRATDDDTDASVPVGDVMDALKAGRAIVTSGPFIEAAIAGAGPGQTAYAAGVRSELHVRVLAPSWISANRVRILQGFDAHVVHDVPIAESRLPVRLDRTFSLDHVRGTFVIVCVLGDTPLPNSGRGDIRPFAFTNPIWIAP